MVLVSLTEVKNENQRDIAKKLHCSVATVTKVSYWLNSGGNGFKKVIEKLPERYEIPKDLPPGPIEFHLPQTLIALTQYSLAKRQTSKLKRFSKEVESKKTLDRNLREMFKEEFSNRKKKQKI